MTFKHRTNPINMKDNKTIPPQSSFLPLIPLHTNMGRPLCLSMQRGRALISNSSEGRSNRAAFMMIWERTPDRSSRGPAIGVTTPRPRTASQSLTSKATLCPRENTTVLLCPDPSVRRNRGPQRMPMYPQPFLSLLRMT